MATTVYPVHIETEDHVTLHGALHVPEGAPRELAIVGTHGTGGNFYGGMLGWLGPKFAEHGFTALMLNRRDHDDQYADSTFEDGLKDFRAAGAYLRSLGYPGFSLIGTSLGSTFAAHYAAAGNDPNLKALGLYGAIDDLPRIMRENTMKELYQPFLDRCHRLVAEGHGHELQLMPRGEQIMITTAASFINYRGPDSNARPVRCVENTAVPILLIHGSRDTLTPDSHHQSILASAKAAGRAIDYVQLDDPEARTPMEGHNLIGLEGPAMEASLAWLARHVPESARTLPGAQRPPEQPYTTHLARVQTSDGVRLDGWVYEPKQRQHDLGVLVTHGTSGNFYRYVPEWLCARLAEQGFVTAAFNRRDHEAGHGASLFENGPKDVRAALDELSRRGIDRVFLVGHSLGTLFASWYAAYENDLRVAGLGLFGTLYDLPEQMRERTMKEVYPELVRRAQEAVAAGKAGELMIVPFTLGRSLVLSAQNFLSYRGPDAKTRGVEHMHHLRVPVLLVHDVNDSMSPAMNHERMRDAATGHAPSVEYHQIPTRHDVSAMEGHAFAGNEAEAITLTLDWLRRTGLSGTRTP